MITVGELRHAIKDLPDDAEIVVWVYESSADDSDAEAVNAASVFSGYGALYIDVR